MKNKANTETNAYTLIERLREYPKFDYRQAMRALYYTYQNSKGWDYVRREVRARDNNTCQDCGQAEGKLIVHHNDYYNWGSGDRREVNHCVLVCVICHNKRHRDNSVNVPFWAGQNDELSREEKGKTKNAFKNFAV